MDVLVALVLCEDKTHSATWPSEQNSFGKLGREDGLHATSKPDAIQGEVAVVKVQNHLGILEHLLSRWALALGKLDHLELALLLLQDLPW